LQNFNLRPPEIPLLSNITAQALTSADELRQELIDHLTLPVQWNRSVQTAVGQGVDTFIEVGPRQVLSGLIRRISRNVQSISLGEMEILKMIGMTEETARGEEAELPAKTQS
jgi:[acyl-carrier-protein] S-malonyltransferase